MARRTQNTGNEDEDRRPTRRSQQKGLPLTPLLLLGVLLVGTILLARQIAGQQDAENDESNATPEEELFSNVPDELPPGMREPGGSTPRGASAPTGALAESTVWLEALAIGEEADALLDEARDGKAKGDHSVWQAKGKAAKEAYDKAWTMTMELEDEFLAKYDGRDRVVRQMQRKRKTWADNRIALHKTTGR